MNYTLITIIGGIVFGAIRVFFWFRGRDDAEKEIELEQKTEALEEVEKKRKRDNMLDRNPSLRERLRKLYPADKD